MVQVKRRKSCSSLLFIDKTWSDHSAAKIFRAELFSFLTVLLLQRRAMKNLSFMHSYIISETHLFVNSTEMYDNLFTFVIFLWPQGRFVGGEVCYMLSSLVIFVMDTWAVRGLSAHSSCPGSIVALLGRIK